MFAVLTFNQLDTRARANAADSLAAFALADRDSPALFQTLTLADRTSFPIVFEYVEQLESHEHFKELCLASLARSDLRFLT